MHADFASGNQERLPVGEIWGTGGTVPSEVLGGSDDDDEPYYE